jgi:hypothetical protein
MNLGEVATVGGLISSTISALRNARDLAKDSSDRELKEVIGDAYDGLLSLKEKTLDMDQEIRGLKEQLAQKAKFTEPTPPFGYVYRADDIHRNYPLCPTCSLKGGYLETESYGPATRRSCRMCPWFCDESPTVASPIRIARMR